MKRKSFSMLAICALLGAGATGFLVVTLLGDSGRAQRSEHASANARRDESRGEAGAKKHLIRANQPRSARVRGRSGAANSSARPGAREPFDSPGTLAERRAWTNRVFEILETIPATDDSARKRAMLIEMQKLFRRLGHRVPADVRDRLFEMLTAADPQWRPLIGDTIGNLSGDATMARKLVDLYKQRPEHVLTRRAILRALGKMNVTEVVPDLLGMVRAGYDNEDRVVETLGRIGGRDVALGLLEHLGRKALQPKTRNAIQVVLGNLKNPEVLDKIERELPGADAKARVSYLHVLAATRNAKHAPAVLRSLERETDIRARKAAIRALGYFGDEKSGEKLLEMVQGGSSQDRLDATRALFQIRNGATIDRLAEDFSRLSDDARLAVIGAGARLPNPSERLQGIARDGLQDPNRRVRTQSAQLLGKSGNDKAIQPLIGYLRGATGPGERTTALQSLLKIRTKKAANEALANLPSALTDRQYKWYTEQFGKIAKR